MEGILLVNKPIGLSSFKVVQKIRRLTKVKKVGHAGTLDPFASGLLIIAIGKPYTRLLDQFQALSKTYRFISVLGIKTDTADSYGTIIEKTAPPSIPDNLDQVLSKFTGQISQTPPAYSAKKVNGKRAYKLARKGESVTLNTTQVTIHDLSLHHITNTQYPQLHLECQCSKGTYIRTLAEDIATQLNTIGYTKHLTRTAIGPYHIDNAIDDHNLTIDTIRNHLKQDIPPSIGQKPPEKTTNDS